MARARNIKPSLFKNELLGEADPLLTILFQGLWCLADREGRLENRPKRIKAEIFPYRELPEFNGYLTELERLGFIERYEVGGVAVILVLNFTKHQSPHKTEKDSELPEKPINTGSCPLTEVAPLKDETVTDTKSLIPDSLIPDSGLLNTKRPPDGDSCVIAFQDAWDNYPKREGSNPKNKAESCWSARVKEGVEPEQMLSGVLRYKRYCEIKGIINQTFVMQGSRFFGTEKNYENDWSVNHENGTAANRQPAIGSREQRKQAALNAGRPSNAGTVIDNDTGETV